jgi:uncharacterized protein YbjT (DUF2867 family)
METEMTKVLVAGATGWLGGKIAGELLKRGAEVRLMARGGLAHPKAKDLAPLLMQGADLVDADLSDQASLVRATTGIDIVVSAVQGGPESIVEGQVNLAEAAKANGVKLLVPSDFSVRFDGVDEAHHAFLGMRRRADDAIAALGLPQLHPLNGAFIEMLRQPFFGLIDWDARSVRYWGDVDQPYDFTLTDDVAAYVAAALVAADPAPGDLEVVGERASPRDLARIAGEVTGQSFRLVSLGSLADLDAEIARRQGEAPTNPGLWAGLQYHRLMANGSGLLRAPANARYRDVKPTGLAAWLAATQPKAEKAA